MLDRLKQGPWRSPQRVETSDTSGEETNASQGRRKILSKKTFGMKKVYAATELDRFSVTGPLDATKMPSHFYCRVCRKNVSVLTHGHHEVLRHFQAVVTLPVISACVWKHLGGACWISKEIHCVRMSWSVRGRRFERVLL